HEDFKLYLNDVVGQVTETDIAEAAIKASTNETILQATFYVILVKAGASPHSPPPAYLAVAFQGIAAALFFTLVKNFRIAVLLFSIVSMIESASQKFIIMTILYGESIWKAFDSFSKSVLDSFGFQVESNVAYNYIIGYVLLYSFWGLILGIWLGGVRQRLPLNKKRWTDEVSSVDESESVRKPRRFKSMFFLYYLMMMVGILGVFIVIEEDTNNLIYIVIRSVAAIILVFGVVNPLFKWWLKKQTQNEGYAADVAKITSEFISLRTEYTQALKLTKKAKWRPDRYLKGVELLIAKRVHMDDER
ncbi:MAG: hypothetical protein ACPGAK_02860, partial [Bacteroidia bacterium]